MVHYVPASLGNITEVVSYAVDEENDDKMKRIVASANLWCERKMTRESNCTEYDYSVTKV